MSSVVTAPLPSIPAAIYVPVRLRYSKAQAAEMLGISETEVKRLILSGDLRTGSHGRLRLIPHDALMAYYRRWLAENGIEQLEEESTEYEAKKEALPLARKRTQTRNLRSSAKTLKSR